MDKCYFAIIGGGVSGLLAAISAAQAMQGKGHKIIILESGTQCGAKLLLSGSGQCNFTHAGTNEEFLSRCREYKNYLKPAYYTFSNTQFIKLLSDAGCPSVTRDDAKVFPASMKASDVRDCLLNTALRLGVQVKYHAKVNKVEKTVDGGFAIATDNLYQVTASHLLIATGGGSYPKTGSDGWALKLAKSLGHRITPFRAHLCGISLKNYAPYKQCAGISIPKAVIQFRSKETQFSDCGDLLFTHDGLSGPVILDNSYRICAGMSIALNLIPDYKQELTDLLGQIKNATLINALSKLSVPRRLLSTILEQNGFDPAHTISGMNKKDINRLQAVLLSCKFVVSSVETLETAMASAGGVLLSEVNSKSMESRICKGLYFAGEVLDYALPSGGFNIQIAASTGWLAGQKASAFP
jgi:predicted Rossmann fold flavoprotein